MDNETLQNGFEQEEETTQQTAGSSSNLATKLAKGSAIGLGAGLIGLIGMEDEASAMVAKVHASSHLIHGILHKLMAVLFTAFIAVFLFGGTAITIQKAYAETPATPATSTPAATGTPTTPATTATKSTKDLCTAITDAKYLADGSCFVPNAKDCSALGTDYEQKTAPDVQGIVCQKKLGQLSQNPEEEKALKGRVYVLLAFEKFLNTLIWPVLVMTGDLMNNNILFGAGMDERLREIWIPVRNLINLFFVLAMVAIAIYNILGIGDDNDAYSIKQILPKMIIAIVAVNFSFIGIKVFLDGINVLTTAVFALPDQVKEGVGNISTDPEMVQRFCLGTAGKTIGEVGTTSNTPSAGLDLASYKIIILDFAEKNNIDIKAENLYPLNGKNELFSFIFDSKALTDTQKKALESKILEEEDDRVCKNDATLTTRGKAFLAKYSSQNAALAMALNMSKIVFYPELDMTTITEGNISKLVVNTIFSVAMYLIFVASFLALFIVLLARLVVMWLGIVASPVIIVALVLPVFKDKLGFGPLIEKFVKNAIAPLLMAFAMTIGWIMLRAIQNVNVLSSDAVTLTNGIPVAGLNTIQDLIVAVATVAVLWIAVFAAASESIAQPVTDKIKGFLGGTASFLGNMAWKYTPLFPVSIPGQPKIMANPEMITKALTNLKNKESENVNAISDAIGATPRGKRFEDIIRAQSGKEALRIMRDNEQRIRKGGDEIDQSLKQFITSNGDGKRFYDNLRSGGSDEKKLHELITKITDDKLSDEDRKTAKKLLADHINKRGKALEERAEKIEGGEEGEEAETKPEYKPQVTKDSKVGGTAVGEPKVAALTEATDKLTKALNDKTKKEEDIKPLLKGFEANGKTATTDELKSFISDPEARKRLKEVFGTDEKLKKAIDEANTAQPAKAAMVQPQSTPTNLQGTQMAQASPALGIQPTIQPIQPNKPENENPSGAPTGTV